MLQKLALLFAAGGLGTVARYALAGFVQRLGGAGFPWGTLSVNALGCLLFGLAVGALQDRLALTPQLRPFLLVGFLGAFTTFSTFSFETAELLLERQWLYASLNVVAHNVIGVAFVIAGLALGRGL